MNRYIPMVSPPRKGWFTIETDNGIKPEGDGINFGPGSQDINPGGGGINSGGTEE